MSNSMNNWLGFSLSPQDQDHESQNSHVSRYSDEISAVQVPSLNLPPPTSTFGIFEAFHDSQDWNMNNTFSCNNQNMEQNQERPKLENFLGHSFSTTTDNNPNIAANYHHNPNGNNAYNNNNNIYQETEATSQHTNSSSTIGLSMIKNWLRNNPAPPHVAEEKEAAALQTQGGGGGGAQSLSLSMSTGSQSTSKSLVLINNNVNIINGTTNNAMVESCTSSDIHTTKLNQSTTTTAVDSPIATESVQRKSIDTFGQRTSIYRGVTRHRWTGRYEAHLWDNSCRREGQTRKGRQGGYDKEEKAARAYDLAALKYWGTTTTTNFPISNYEKEIEEMKHMTRQEYVASLRRKSSGFSRGASIYRGVTRHHQHGRWQARIGRVAGNKDLYLGTFGTQEEAAEAYDIAAIKFRGLNAVTNFEINRYDVKSIMESSTLPIGGAAKRLKDAENAELALEIHRANEASLNLHLTENGYGGTNNNQGWPTIAFQHQTHQPLSMFPNYAHQRLWCKQEQDTDLCHGFSNDIGNTQNFMQPYVLHNLMSLDSSTMEHSSGSNSVVYGTGDGNNVSFAMPLINQSQGNGFVGGNNDEGIFGNLYYHQSTQQSASNGIEKASIIYEQGSGCNNWIPTGVPTLAASRTNMAVWNVDT
ncbi:hypothetical protein RD792_003633 [Penstemon davidsonii]|uniref:AP2/ERF domain-containing protein n=1 Tax=Penstemon davidsonii TaxID=160366 RepID=A0ABR0DFA8_9LAMI|nr:hypothetical protein RD792_003633 [Penstemon davidsonii]